MIANALGLVLLPDEWICPDGIQLVSIGQTSATWDDYLGVQEDAAINSVKTFIYLII